MLGLGAIFCRGVLAYRLRGGGARGGGLAWGVKVWKQTVRGKDERIEQAKK